VLGFRLNFGEISPFGQSEEKGISLNERFELGGAGSMRGYEEASIGPLDARKKHSGYVMINANGELRFPVLGKLWMGLFIDSGGVWMERGEIDPRDLKFSYGIGLRYSLPMGPLRLDYARRLTDATADELGRLYVAIGHIF
jgi:outer membrane protein insertion porin family